jgi:ribonuclease P protein component
MLKKRLRLRGSEVEEVLKDGRSVRSPHMQVKWLGGQEPLRSAAIVAKSVARKATSRNALRRAMYRAIASATPPLPHARALFFLRMVPKEPPSAILKDEVAFLISRII